jgi:hypothetical protein
MILTAANALFSQRHYFGLLGPTSNNYYGKARGGHSETKLAYGNYFYTLNGAQNIVPLIDVNGAHFSKHTLNQREWRPFLETYPYLWKWRPTL